MVNKISDVDYVSIIENVLIQIFKCPDMTEEDWNLFKVNKGISVSDLVEDMKMGVRNGYSVELQLDLIKIFFGVKNK